nr:callose synthase 3-like [Tanacetum cinerariifolium]
MEAMRKIFLSKVVTPICEVIAKEAAWSKVGKSKHYQWRNYDDMNELQFTIYIYVTVSIVLFLASGGSDRDAEDALSKLLQMEKEKEHIIKKKAYIIISLQSESASPKIKWTSDAADEDIGVDEVISAIDCVFHIRESNEVRSKFGEFSENKKSVVEVVMGGGETLGVYREKRRGAAKGGRKVLCYVQGSGRLKKKKTEAQRRLWDPEIKSAFQDNTLRATDFEGVRNDTSVDMHMDFVMGWDNHHTYQFFMICV